MEATSTLTDLLFSLLFDRGGGGKTSHSRTPEMETDQLLHRDVSGELFFFCERHGDKKAGQQLWCCPP